MINKKRKADEGIGKLIIFAFTVILATSLVWLIHHFYTRSKINTTNSILLVSVNNKWDKLQYIITNKWYIIWDNDNCGCAISGDDNKRRIYFDPVNNSFTMTWITVTDNSDRCLNCFKNIWVAKVLSNTDVSVEYLIKD